MCLDILDCYALLTVTTLVSFSLRHRLRNYICMFVLEAAMSTKRLTCKAGAVNG